VVRSYREDCNAAKDARRGITEQKPVGRKSSKAAPKLFMLQYMSHFHRYEGNTWRKWGRYRTEEEANRAMAQMQRKLPTWGWRVVDCNQLQ
jgi:hypothetical protein